MTTALRARPTGTAQPLSEHYQPAQWASRVHQRKTRLVRGNSGAASGNSVPGGARQAPPLPLAQYSSAISYYLSAPVGHCAYREETCYLASEGIVVH